MFNRAVPFFEPCFAIKQHLGHGIQKGPSKSCGRQTAFKEFDTNFTWFILEYLDPFANPIVLTN